MYGRAYVHNLERYRNDIFSLGTFTRVVNPGGTTERSEPEQRKLERFCEGAYKLSTLRRGPQFRRQVSEANQEN